MSALLATDWSGPDEIRRGAAYRARLALWRAGELVEITSASVRLLDRSGTELVSGDAELDAGVATYQLEAALTEDVDPQTGWTLVWSYQVDGMTEPEELVNPVEVVLYSVKPVLTWATLLKRHHDLTDRLAADNQAGAEETAEDCGQDYIDEAWKELCQRLRAKGKRYLLVVDSYQLELVHTYLTLAIGWRDLSVAPDSHEDREATRYEEKFKTEWESLTFEEASPDSWARTGVRKSARPSVWTGSSGSGSFRPRAGTPRSFGSW